MGYLVPFSGAPEPQLRQFQQRREAAGNLRATLPMPKHRYRRQTLLGARLDAYPRIHFVGRWPTVRQIVERCAALFEVDPEDIVAHTRPPSLVFSRQLVYFLARVLTRHSIINIGNLLGRDHSTILFGINRIADRLDVDPEFRAEVEAVERFVLEGWL